MFRPVSPLLLVAAVLGCDLAGPELVTFTLEACVETGNPFSVCGSPGDPAYPETSVFARILDHGGQFEELALSSNSRARLRLTSGVYRVDIVYKDLALDCHELVIVRFGADSTRISWSEPHEFQVTADDEGMVRRINCEPYPYRFRPEYVTMATLGQFAFEVDSVKLSQGQLLNFNRWPPEPIPDDAVTVLIINNDPEIIRCIQGDAYELELRAWDAHKCENLASPDSSFLVTEEVRETLVPLMPCLAETELRVTPSDGQELSVGIRDCVQYHLVTTELGPGLEWKPGEHHMLGLLATECGDSWVARTKRDGWMEQWPEPFPSYTRLEVEIAC